MILPYYSKEYKSWVGDWAWSVSWARDAHPRFGIAYGSRSWSVSWARDGCWTDSEDWDWDWAWSVSGSRDGYSSGY